MKLEAANTDAWNIAKGKNPERPSVLRFRPSLEGFLGDANYPRRLMIVWQFEAADATGMPNDTQSADMKDFENMLIDVLDPDRLAVLAFVYTTGGTREWHFYLSDVSEVGIRINQALSNIPQLPIDLTVEDDPNWDELRQVFQMCQPGR
ncbi:MULTISPECIES: DUF695 domain-containing protein [unclassified Lentimonas]|uniref:DUF695 domain-containing protein n=1 Tax=unclassified Lentimonas TaxID=2630993 RepID=UPI001327D663|nr:MULTISPECIES: DUF695 domain-containing protein [unclassified Lentimonas]CAA6678227.1 Unannotated [Lentimonas sp. CC4]CAA6684877.1 Unannotated [Lentimonas sp. CC6]CAA6689801.1 Unannotated [Lentimonas sp. CC19]CAA6690660.1 Unannotated [Lentimonas sp. CC10]CAA7068914.1 Unannotated [Lentimonas sp. CC11]